MTPADGIVADPAAREGAEAVAPPRRADRALYESDEHLWIAAQVAALLSGRLGDLDRETLAEYLTDMATRDRREVESRLAVLLMHILKTLHQPERPSRSWVNTIAEQQDELRAMLRLTPSLRRVATEAMAPAWERAARGAARETGLPTSRLPAVPTLTLDEALTYTPPEVAKLRAGERRGR